MAKRRELDDTDDFAPSDQAPPIGPLGLDTRPVPAPTPAQEAAKPAEPRGRQNSPPACPYCSKDGTVVLCKSGRSEPFFTRYYCPTAGCAYSAKMARPDLQKRLRRQREEEDFSAR